MKNLFFGMILVVVVALSFWAGRNSQPTASVSSSGQGQASPGAERKILYYRNPMGQPDTSPVPKQDPMGMDYIPVYAGEEPEDKGTIKISVARLQKLGVATTLAETRVLSHPLRAMGTLEVNERGLHTVTARFDGWVERLMVNTTGQSVKKGEALMSVYSPDLVAAQQEYRLAREGLEALREADMATRSRAEALLAASRKRLELWQISPVQLAQLDGGEVKRDLRLTAPVSGVVLDKPVLPGKRFTSGEPLIQIADVSSLWLIAEVFEQDLGRVREGQGVKFTMEAFPGETFKGRVAFVYPTLKPDTRTGRVRIELNNSANRLKPAMFGQVEIATQTGQKVVAVPDSAVLDSGEQQTVLVSKGEGRFEPRKVSVGDRVAGWVEIRAGLKAGETVVTRANFLIDSESNLKAALAGFTAEAKLRHEGDAKVVAIDVQAKQVTLSHGPIASLKWPSMTMDFSVSEAALLKDLKPGQKVHFQFEEHGEGEWMITRISAQGH